MAPGHLRATVPGVVDDRHLERREPLCNAFADAAHPDQSDRPIAERRAEREVFLQPPPLAEESVRLGQPAHRREEERDGEIRYLVVQDFRSIGDHDAAPRGGLNVDRIVSHAIVADDLERGEPRQESGVEAIPSARDDRPDGGALPREQGLEAARAFRPVHRERWRELLLDFWRGHAVARRIDLPRSALCDGAD